MKSLVVFNYDPPLWLVWLVPVVLFVLYLVLERCSRLRRHEGMPERKGGLHVQVQAPAAPPEAGGETEGKPGDDRSLVRTEPRKVPLNGKVLQPNRYYWLTDKRARLLVGRDEARHCDPQSVIYMGILQEGGVEVYGKHRPRGWCGKVRLGDAVDLLVEHDVCIHPAEHVGVEFCRAANYNGRNWARGDVGIFSWISAQQMRQSSLASILHYDDAADEPPPYEGAHYVRDDQGEEMPGKN